MSSLVCNNATLYEIESIRGIGPKYYLILKSYWLVFIFEMNGYILAAFNISENQKNLLTNSTVGGG
jgi:hypothetical protein